jgi:cell division protein FtsW (lipid II flippase)
MGLLPVMGQPLPFLSYSNNLLLLFALPFSFLMIILCNNMEEQ